jgi:hypothetical protein
MFHCDCSPHCPGVVGQLQLSPKKLGEQVGGQRLYTARPQQLFMQGPCQQTLEGKRKHLLPPTDTDGEQGLISAQPLKLLLQMAFTTIQSHTAKKNYQSFS